MTDAEFIQMQEKEHSNRSLLANYVHLIPPGVTVSGKEFGLLIKRHYPCGNYDFKAVVNLAAVAYAQRNIEFVRRGSDREVSVKYIIHPDTYIKVGGRVWWEDPEHITSGWVIIDEIIGDDQFIPDRIVVHREDDSLVTIEVLDSELTSYMEVATFENWWDEHSLKDRILIAKTDDADMWWSNLSKEEKYQIWLTQTEIE